MQCEHCIIASGATHGSESLHFFGRAAARAERLGSRPAFASERASEAFGDARLVRAGILDHLAEIEAAVPGLGGRLDRSRIVACGHSPGGHTVGRLTGIRVTDPADGEEENLIDPRIQAGGCSARRATALTSPPSPPSTLSGTRASAMGLTRGLVFSLRGLEQTSADGADMRRLIGLQVTLLLALLSERKRSLARATRSMSTPS